MCVRAPRLYSPKYVVNVVVSAHQLAGCVLSYS
jgi:hypothetical protein